MSDKLELIVSVKKKANKFTITYDNTDYDVALKTNELNLFELDGVISRILEMEIQKINTKLKLSGKDTGPSTSKSGIILG